MTPSGGLTALVRVGASELLLVDAAVAVMLMAAIIREEATSDLSLNHILTVMMPQAIGVSPDSHLVRVGEL